MTNHAGGQLPAMHVSVAPAAGVTCERGDAGDANPGEPFCICSKWARYVMAAAETGQLSIAAAATMLGVIEEASQRRSDAYPVSIARAARCSHGDIDYSADDSSAITRCES